MGKLIDITGQRFNKLVALHKVKAKDKASSYWLFQCDCGKQTVLGASAIRRGKQVSCGCYRWEMLRNGETRKTHGMANKTRTYKSWKEMRQRCLNSKNGHWKWYGARGISICQRWLDSYENFLADMGDRPEGKSIDRIDVNGNYEPSNCRWATPKQQAENNRGCFRKGNIPWQK